VSEYRAEEGDIYLLCSDGLTDMMTDERIAAILVTAGTLEEKSRALVDAANDSGGRDNISVILAQARSRPVRRGLLSRMLGQ
jgi:protein phosphatase